MNELKIVCLACTGEGGPEASLDRATQMITSAARSNPDLICLPEIFAWTDLTGDQKIAAAEPIDGPTGKAMARLAKLHEVNICVPLLEKDCDLVHNSAVWFDRRGELVGVYRKVFPTDYEMAEGVVPGQLDFDVFHTEFGPIGCCICFDLNFGEVVERIASQQAKLVLFPTMFQGMSLMQAWAKLCEMYFVSVAAQPYSAAVNPIGTPTSLPWLHDPDMIVGINLDYVVLHSDHNSKKFADIRAALGDRVEIDYQYNESAVLLTSKHPEMSAVDIVANYGLETAGSYYERTKKIRRRMTEKK